MQKFSAHIKKQRTRLCTDTRLSLISKTYSFSDLARGFFCLSYSDAVNTKECKYRLVDSMTQYHAHAFAKFLTLNIISKQIGPRPKLLFCRTRNCYWI